MPDVQERAKAIIAQAMSLPVDIREGIAIELLISTQLEDEDSVRQAWKVEIARRIEEIQNGEVELTDVNVALDSIERRIREKFHR